MYDLVDPELDPLPKILIEIRDDPVVHEIVGNRVRGKEPQGPVMDASGNELQPGDVRPAGHWVPFVVLTRIGAPPDPRVPIQTTRILFRCAGRTDREAAVLRNACSRAIHGRGPRTFPNGLGIFSSLDVTGGSQDADPDTKQPFETFIAEVVATVQAVV